MRNSGGLWVVALIMLLLDTYVFTAVRALVQNSTEKIKLITYSAYWSISILAIVLILLFPFVQWFQTHRFFRNYVFAILVGLFIAKVIAALFFIVDDARRGTLWLMAKLFSGEGTHVVEPGSTITRSSFLSWLGIAAGGGIFSTLMYGFSNKYNYQLKRVRLSYKNLPSSFKGLKIIQISDIHSGSFQDTHAVNHGVEMLMKEKPDLILFTGDLVNDRADEMKDYIDVFSKLNAPLGVYSTLGNHDYGDYIEWPSPEAKVENLERLKGIHKQMGWRLLMNEHVPIEKNGESIALIGIENWGAKARFPKYGKMNEAYPGSEKYPFKILMSHDPSHWDAEVRAKYPDIDLTLAGHTHGMQFGIENPYFKWSPVQWVYKQWAGLYEEKNQKLYVNRGYGFIGYPGRVGILPEITLIELT